MSRMFRIIENKVIGLFNDGWVCQFIKRGLGSLVVLLSVALFSAQASATFIAVSVSSEDNFRNSITDSIEEAVNARNDYVYIDDVDNDFDEQVKQIQHYIDSGADAIVIFATGTHEQNKQLLKFSKKVPLVFVNTEPVADLSTMPANTVYVGSNEVDSGTMQMEALAKLADYHGKVALLKGEMSHPAAITRTKDVYDVVAKYPDLSVVAAETGNWQRNQGYNIVEKWVKDNLDFNILVSNNDEMLMGGLMALSDNGKDVKSYYTGGIDGIHDALLEMQKGNLDITVLQDGKGQGRAVVDMAYRMLNHQAVKNPHWVPFKLITQENYKLLLDGEQ
ncbi:MAG: substrate-binding domain-containing protein [Vibrio sp.]